MADEPVEARPASAWYRFRKLARRNKAALTTIALVAATLLVATAASAWLAVAASQARSAAIAESAIKRSDGSRKPSSASPL